MESPIPIVCDNGTGFMKIGWAGDSFPEATYPTLLGRPMLRYEEKIENIELKSLMVGDEAAPVRSMLELSHPIDNGIVKDWEGMTHLWNYGIRKKLKVEDCSGMKILLTEAPLNPKINKEKMAEIMFEKFRFAAVKVSVQAVLALHAEGLLSGLVLDAGDGVTHCIPVYEGFANDHLIKRLNVAGRHVTKYLLKLLLIRGYAFNSTADFETVRELKEKLCYVAYDLKVDRKLAKETTVLDTEYTLPDGSVIKVGRERFEAAECLFHPFLIDNEQDGISDQIYNTIESSAIDIRPELYGNILLSGGTTMFPGLPSRIQKDLSDKFNEQIKAGTRTETKTRLNIIDPPRRKHGVFLGGSVCANAMKDDESFWITREQYYEGTGKTLLHQNMN